MSTPKIVITNEPIGTISPLIHGHFAEHLGRCCYDGLWVGRNSKIPNYNGFRSDVVDALKRIGIPQLRWPGGCFADSYHWREGIGPAGTRNKTVAESCSVRVMETNDVGTHEFIELCRMLGSEPYLAGNVGSGSPQELSDWITYCNDTTGTSLADERAANGHPDSMNVKYWGVGNENWACGGNYDAPDYGKEFRRFATFMKMADSNVELIACGHNDRDWNTQVVEQLRNHVSLLDHISVHQYWRSGNAVEFNEDDYYRMLRGIEAIEDDLKFTAEILDYFIQGRRKVGIAFDEWGVWHPEAHGGSAFEAPSTMRDAVFASTALDLFQRWCDRVSMANIAQIVNVLHSLVQTDGEGMWLTPTYHVFGMYAAHRGARALKTDIVNGPELSVPALSGDWPLLSLDAGAFALLSASASLSENGITVSVTNRHRDQPIELEIEAGGRRFDAGTLATLAADAPNAVNSASQPERVTVKTSRIAGGKEIRLTLPPCSVSTLTLS